jgi:hypothetical protein
MLEIVKLQKREKLKEKKQSGEAVCDYIHMSPRPRIMRYACIYCINKGTKEQRNTI